MPSLTPNAVTGVDLTPARLLNRLLARSWARSRRVQVILDLAMVAVTVMTFGHVAPPEILFHVIFIVLIAHAFLFGLQGTLWRIAIVSVVIVAYSVEARTVTDLDEMDLAEWPLMFVIAVLVALMADRREVAARHYEAIVPAGERPTPRRPGGRAEAVRPRVARWRRPDPHRADAHARRGGRRSGH